MEIISKPLKLNFDNSVIKNLPIDPIKENYVRKVKGSCFSLVNTTPVKDPVMVSYYPEVLELLDISEEEAKSNLQELAECLCGNKKFEGGESAAHCYCGHQFGYFSGQLGDGRAIYLGEVLNKKGERWEIQLKGAGKTPYSRGADGRAVLRSSIREFLCSEAMYALGIPTTRAGTLVNSETYCSRDPLYQGKEIEENCAIVSRIAPSFIRFGSFEIFKGEDPLTKETGSSYGLEKELLPKMLNYLIDHHFKEFSEEKDDVKRYSLFYEEVVKRTAIMVAKWQCVGFCHGVLNTDNMSILGLTIDYGPFGFMDEFDRDFICNGSDHGGRYSYQNQPKMVKWNLEKLAEALNYCLPSDISKKILEEKYDLHFNEEYNSKMHKKIGLFNTKEEGDVKLVETFFDTLQATSCDMTNSFRLLNKIFLEEKDGKVVVNFEEAFKEILLQTNNLEHLLTKYTPNMPQKNLLKVYEFDQSNPGMLEQMGSQGERLLTELRKFKKFINFKDLTEETLLNKNTLLWKEWLLTYSERILRDFAGFEDIKDIKSFNEKRIKILNENNPRFVLRNYIAEKSIRLAKKGKYEEVNRLRDLFRIPFTEDEKYKEYESKPPDWAKDLCVTCSS
eukprot:TRINITY_DN5264_c0_g3_i1.p1 TRINITY_DN5264_c0_g3~~TRINITY_DN5264_c0_g3_i1.p1  ORF type:complete len:617 (-),score=206.72 TRINITY_DN5264_c0_g3_i1:54-1904(-)